MACKVYENRLNELEDWLHGALERAEREELDRHLVACSACREELELARECSTLLREVLAPAGEPSGAFWFKIQAGIRRAVAPQDFWTSLEWTARRVAWAAGFAVLLLGAYTLNEIRPSVSAEVREIFPDPNPQPANQEEILLTLAEGRAKR